MSSRYGHYSAGYWAAASNIALNYNLKIQRKMKIRILMNDCMLHIETLAEKVMNIKESPIYVDISFSDRILDMR